MNINLNLYRTFLIVAQSKSYADASNKLNISKTAIGKNIQQLEEQLNTKLFYRESKGISLTAEGRILYNFIDKSLSEIDFENSKIGKITKTLQYFMVRFF